MFAAQVSNERCNVHVVNEPVVIEFLEPFSMNLERTSQASYFCVLLQYDHLRSKTAELVRGGEASESRTNDNDTG